MNPNSGALGKINLWIQTRHPQKKKTFIGNYIHLFRKGIQMRGSPKTEEASKGRIICDVM